MRYTALIGLTLIFALLHLTLASAEVLRLDKNSFNPGENIQVYFEASGNFDRSAWVGIIPSSVAHESEAENDNHDMTYQYLEKRTSGTLTFQAPQDPGSYDLRMFDTDNNGREVASITFSVEVGKGTLRLDKDLYKPGESITASFEASDSFDRSAWVGIVPSSVAHGSEAENDNNDLTYQYLEKRTSGTLTFKAPLEPGSYDLRMFDSDNNGREVASVSFVVQGSASVPVPANSPTNTNPPQTTTTSTQGEGNKNIDLTGIWSCDDAGTYYIRQIGNAVWWDGEDTAANPRWANVAHGTISGNTVTLEYADVPEGTAIGYGTLVLDIISNDELRAKEKPESYGGSHWTRSGIKPEPPISPPVNPSVNQPANQPVVASPWNDPSIRQLIDEWILQQDKCVKKVYPGTYIDKWGRICGDTGTTTISCVLTPDHPADWDSYHYLWFNNPCPEYYPYRVQAYVGYRQSGSSFDSLAGCKGEGDSCKA